MCVSLFGNDSSDHSRLRPRSRGLDEDAARSLPLSRCYWNGDAFLVGIRLLCDELAVNPALSLACDFVEDELAT